jgi:environmental stress-induced protein Ves
MILDGQMNLAHEGQHKSQLSKYDIDRFDGGWNTTSSGTCVDFNLMLRNDLKGDVEGLELAPNTVQKYEFDERVSLFFYLVSGELKIALDEDDHDLTAGDLLCLDPNECFEIELISISGCELAVVKIN